MSRKRTRALTPDEKALWDRVREKANPMHRSRESAPRLSEVFAPPQAEVKPISPFKVEERRTATALSLPAMSSPSGGQIDKKVFTNLKRGKLKPEAKIDLHGMSLAQAHGVLMRFIHMAQQKGFRLVLVITGKGKDRDDGGPMPTHRGILRRQVPDWLNAPPLSNLVLQITEAHIKHGGSGAYYVYLRRRKP